MYFNLIYLQTNSDREYDGRQRQLRSGVRFYDDTNINTHLHDLHQSVRDISSDQVRIQDDLSREIHRRNKQVIFIVDELLLARVAGKFNAIKKLVVLK